MSLAGVEYYAKSCSKHPMHLLVKKERLNRGIKEGLIRFSVGIEESKDLIARYKNKQFRNS